MDKFNEIGKKYGNLTVIERAENYKNGSAMWYCICDCGNPNKIRVRAASLRDGHTKSCGCLIVEKTKEVHKNKIVSEQTRKRLSDSAKGPKLNARSDIGKKFPATGKYKRGSFVVRKINSIKNSAKTRGHQVTISKEEIADLITSPCTYCGRKSDYDTYKGCNGIDRVDNSLGYVDGNCVSSCIYCNMCKNTRPVDVFRKHIINMYETFIKGK